VENLWSYIITDSFYIFDYYIYAFRFWFQELTVKCDRMSAEKNRFSAVRKKKIKFF